MDAEFDDVFVVIAGGRAQGIGYAVALIRFVVNQIFRIQIVPRNLRDIVVRDKQRPAACFDRGFASPMEKFSVLSG